MDMNGLRRAFESVKKNKRTIIDFNNSTDYVMSLDDFITFADAQPTKTGARLVEEGTKVYQFFDNVITGVTIHGIVVGIYDSQCEAIVLLSGGIMAVYDGDVWRCLVPKQFDDEGRKLLVKLLDNLLITIEDHGSDYINAATFEIVERKERSTVLAKAGFRHRKPSKFRVIRAVKKIYVGSKQTTVNRAAPDHRVKVPGFWRKCRVGKDQHGNPILGRTWVVSHERYKDKPLSESKIIYVKEPLK